MKEELQKITREISLCTKCVLHKTRTNTVPGTGSANPKIMFIGEAPGANEDLQGKPFVGRAGNLLTQLIESINLTREDVFIGNILKCRPPGNRNPKPEEIKTCTPYLERQINTLRPKVIAPLGTFSTNFILTHYGIQTSSISKIHGKTFKANTLLGEITIIPQYHPAAALYNPNLKQELFNDFQKLRNESL